MSTYFGIDFGTTNSAVVLYDRRKSGNRFTHIGGVDENPFPSVVAVDNLTQEVLTGLDKYSVIRLREGGMHLVVESVKSVLDSGQVWTTPNRTWRAENIASELFKSLSQRAERVTTNGVREAVLAIPIGMNARRRATLRRAADFAGIKVITFISEPTAAYIAHAEELRHCRYAVVFDWGGGTLDISVLEVRDGCITERYTKGSPRAGDHIDRVLAEWVHRMIAEAHRLNLSFDSVPIEERHLLLNRVETVKRNLQQEEARPQVIRLASYAGLRNVEQVVTQTTLDDLIRNVISDALELLIRSVELSGVSQEEIGKLIVVGGSSQLLSLRKELRRRWPHPNIIFPEQADWDIARGAAWLAANPGCYRTAQNLGVVLADDQFHAIFPSRTKQESAYSKLHFGLVEDAAMATFNFATMDGNDSVSHIGELHSQCFGFRDELIQLVSRLTPDLVFEATATSASKQQTGSMFSFEKLRWIYDVSNTNRLEDGG
jgi:molecular chaperone DnaK